MQRKAVTVTGAAGADEVVDQALVQLGFGPAERVSSTTEALALVRGLPTDLLVVPLQGAGAADLGALEREISRSAALRVIGTAPSAEPDLILRAMRAGVHEFLVSPASVDDLVSAVNRLMQRSRRDEAKHALVAVYAAKGGLGTTTVALNLAWAFARPARRSRVALADFVVNGGDVAMMLNLRPAYDIGDLALKLDQIDASLLGSLMTTTSSGLAVLPASERPETLELVDASASATVLKSLRENYDFTVVDCEHHPTDRTLTALDLADHVLLVTQLTVAAVRSAQRTITLFERLGVPGERVHVVANRTQSSDLISTADAARLLDREPLVRIPNDYKACETALTRGLPVAAQDPGSPVSRAYLTLATKLGAPEVGAAGSTGEQTNGQGSRLGRLFGIGRK